MEKGLYAYLQYCVQHDIVSLDNLRKQMEDLMNRETYLQMHSYEIWQGKNGRFYTYLPGENGSRILKKRSTRRDIEDMVIDFYRNRITVNHLFNQWIENKLLTRSIKEQSYNRYITDFKRFIENTDFGKLEVRAVSEDVLEEFVIETILEKQLTAKAYSQLRTILNGMFKFAKRKKYTQLSISNFFQDLDLSKNMFQRKQRIDAQEVFTDCEVKQITSFVRENPSIWNLAVLLLFQSGLRVGELVALKADDIDWENLALKISRTEIRIKNKETGKYTVAIAEHAKTECGERIVVLPPTALWTLKKIYDANPSGTYLFENEHGKRIRGTTITKRMYGICQSLSIEERSAHKARKTYISELFNAGVDSTVIKSQSGHSDILTSMKYYNKDNHSLAERKKQIERAVVAL